MASETNLGTCSEVLSYVGTKYQSVVTEREGHARELVEQLSLRDLETYDGLIAVRLPRRIGLE